jgi:UDP-glucuronate decarboxylase
MKYLVTGGAGFIGINLCNELIKKGHYVICIDNFLSSSKLNLDLIINKKNFKFINHDIKEPLRIRNIDRIINLACPASPIHYQNDPINTLMTNILGAQNVLNLALKNNSKILQASTSEVYGDPIKHPQDENYFGNVNPIGIRSCYDEGKRAAESLFMDFNRKYNLDIRIIRIFNTYGPYMAVNDGRVISSFIVSALKNKNIIINGNGNQTRSFCYIDDLVSGIIKSINLKKKYNNPINLGNPAEMNIYSLAQKVIKMTGSKSKIIFNAKLDDDPKKRKPNIKKAKSILSWKPKVSLDQGLIKTIKYFERRLNE